MKGPHLTSFKRTAFFKRNFKAVEPTGYFLDSSHSRSFQYVPVLQSLQQVFCNRDIVAFLSAFTSPFMMEIITMKIPFFPENDFSIALILYLDDSEIYNPLGLPEINIKELLSTLFW